MIIIRLKFNNKTYQFEEENIQKLTESLKKYKNKIDFKKSILLSSNVFKIKNNKNKELEDIINNL